MFGVEKKRLVKSLCRLSCRLCAYLGHRCDCKYMHDCDEFIATSSEAGSGCPETAMAARIINALTDKEFVSAAKRAGIQIPMLEGQAVDIGPLMRKLQDQRAVHYRQLAIDTTNKSK